MFRFGRSDAESAEIRWSQLFPLLEDDDRRAAIARDYPEATRESFIKGLKRVDANAAMEILAAGRHLETAAPLANYPTIAVAGMLNSGKTSLVSVFLSPAGRARTLRGDSNAEGTHRFVLWLPQRWSHDADLWGMLLSRIGEALGQTPEMLAEDPAAAHAQYNNVSGGTDALSIPLVATDTGLDQHGVAFLDCPDIVSDAAFGRGAPETRRQLLRKAATLCSSFIVVTGAEAIRDKTLGDLLRSAAELMPGVTRLLAVNKVRPAQTPDAVWANTQELVQLHRIDGVYAAYDFEIPAAEPFVPKLDPDLSATEPVRLPTFYKVEPEPESNPPASIEPDRLLSALPSKLETAELFQQVRLALESRLRTSLWEHGVDRLKLAAEEASKDAAVIRAELLDACLDFFARRQPGGQIAELRMHQSERIVRQLTTAFAEAAPWYARLGMKMNSRLRKIWGGAGDLVARFTPSKIAESAADAVKEKLKSGKQGSLLTPDRLAEAIATRTDISRLPAIENVQHLATKSGRAVDRFDAEDYTSLDPDRLSKAVEEVWRQMPISKKVKAGLTPLAVVFTAFGAALMVPIDFGGTGVLFAASIKELMLAAGVSLVATAWSGGLALLDIEQQAARQQLSNFLAVLCDSLGVPRWDNNRHPLSIKVNGRDMRLPEPTVTLRTAAMEQVAIEPGAGNGAERSLVQWHLRDEFLQELQQHVKRH